MRIVMLGPFGLHPKGTMRARAVPAARALAVRGHRVTVIMPPWHTPEAAGRSWTDEVGSARVEIEYTPLGGLDIPVLGHVIIAWRMARRALDLEPDVVHAFKPKAYSGLACALLWLRRAAGGKGPAVVVDTDDWEGPGGWNDIEPYPLYMRRFFAWQERWGLTHADSVTAASRTLEALVWSLGVNPKRVTYLSNAIDDSGAGAVPTGVADPADRADHTVASNRADRADRPDPVDRADPLYRSDNADRTVPVSRLDRADPATLLLFTRFHDHDIGRPLDVLERVRRRVPGAWLVVAGRGLFGEEAAFVRDAAARGLGDRVEMVGWVEPAAAGELFAAADVAIAPFDDTLVNRARSSMKLIDLLAAGVPVVAEAVGEARELIVDGLSGRLVPSGDVDAFADAVVELLRDLEAGAAMGRAAVERLGREHTWSRRVERLEAVYSGAVNARKRR